MAKSLVLDGLPVAESNPAPYPWYIMEALKVLRPPERLTVTQWADKYRILSELDSASPGHWRTSRTPYLKKIMDAFNDISIREITFCAGAQVVIPYRTSL